MIIDVDSKDRIIGMSCSFLFFVIFVFMIFVKDLFKDFGKFIFSNNIEYVFKKVYYYV